MRNFLPKNLTFLIFQFFIVCTILSLKFLIKKYCVSCIQCCFTVDGNASCKGYMDEYHHCWMDTPSNATVQLPCISMYFHTDGTYLRNNEIRLLYDGRVVT